jgi:hypothetical protein
MAAIPVVNVGINLSFVAATALYASGTPDEMDNDGRTLFAAALGAGAAQRGLRFESQRDCDHGHGAETGALLDYNPTLAAAPSAVTILFGPFPRYRFSTGGKLQVRAESVTLLNYAGLRVPNVYPV